ncbi:hypothetical protein ACFWHT_10955 [Microbacterium sp. NPDC058342]|uniref:hypothetical protein n=1 Tax=Microbacterium sp. NPDC058342 TaxID=3346454 RepID=UPI00364E99F3
MGSKLARGLALTTTALLMTGATACAGTPESSTEPSTAEIAAQQPATSPKPLGLAEAQGDIPWPEGMTLPVPESMSFDGIDSHFACDGTLLAVLITSPDATEETTQAYLESVQDLFAIPADVRSGHGQDSIRDRVTDGLKADGHIQDEPSAMDATKIVGWETLPTGGYRFHLQETAKPGIPVHVANTPAESWTDFPHPDASFKDCEARESSAYREGEGFTPASTTWTLKGPPEIQPQVGEWMKGLAADGWSLSGATESGPKPGAADSILESEDHTAQYILGSDFSVTLVVSDRKLDRFLGL